MSFFSQQPFDIRLEWGTNAVELMAGEADCVIIVDVMSFSSCVSLAVGQGAWVYPYPWKDASAEEYADRLGAVTASETRRFAGNGYSLSPASLANIAPGTKLVLPSPNGSALAFSARDSAAAVFCGGLRNLSATAASCKAYSRILVVAGGEKWPDGSLRPALEDWLAAGGIVSLLPGRSPSPEAQAAAAAYRALASSTLRQCSSARELIERGFSADVDLCLAVDADPHACRLQGDRFTRV
ncbi:2-phosphosulfolactate phosphatase [Serratia ficaria]|uniref:2-phosphosulfolactate phosphatase n=1 Tax=Serratia ficaria TaxID=61651 RepID=UPI0021798F27|nr:2-phosphosulfolactate phosphatase [Serratia ficaria]MEE4484318.1 2-phosphosulfolactate phosphatase [Serratia ficaria]CAI1498929.1 Probable 2-phosphosulfolactate phosphatase [Serratia ficaria]